MSSEETKYKMKIHKLNMFLYREFGIHWSSKVNLLIRYTIMNRNNITNARVK